MCALKALLDHRPSVFIRASGTPLATAVVAAPMRKECPLNTCG